MKVESWLNIIIIIGLVILLIFSNTHAYIEGKGALCIQLVEESLLEGRGVFDGDACYYEVEDGTRYPLVNLLREEWGYVE